MSVIDNLIYDRTQADVDRVSTLTLKILRGGLSSLTEEEKEEYLAGMKGAYNYTDLNRVGQAVTYIASKMIELPEDLKNYMEEKQVDSESIYVLPYDPAEVVVTPKTDWVISDIPVKSQIDTYLSNLRTLKGILELPETAPEVPTSLDQLGYESANNIEELLAIIDTTLSAVESHYYDLINNTVSAFKYCGDEYCGI